MRIEIKGATAILAVALLLSPLSDILFPVVSRAQGINGAVVRSSNPPTAAGGSILSCDVATGFTAGAAASTLIIAGVANKQIMVCSFVFVADAVGTIRFVEANTSSACGAGVVSLSGLMRTGASVPVNFGTGEGLSLGPLGVGKDLCIVTTGAGASVQGVLTFLVR